MPERIAVSTIGLRTERHPLHLPHRVTADIVETYPTTATSDTMARKLRGILGKGGPRWELVNATTRPPFVERPAGRKLAAELIRLASGLDIALRRARPGCCSGLPLGPPRLWGACWRRAAPRCVGSRQVPGKRPGCPRRQQKKYR